ncbi:DMT family transporter [Pseudoruegeria sp. SK021]|uniref:DMT family transporter n=1 Tax=Pseudoruegeria sp. SK021 TaxID=1933035 RepID=UPI000A25E047|nr:DMT family transporter [Pseudoruegeria sp. SK021]OSP54442.1 EamA family transporter [Pseudoruegeria sp. SK021]
MSPFHGIILKILSVITFVSMAACIKAASAEVPAGEAVFFRSFFALPVILIWLIVRGELSVGLTVANPMAHVWRGFVGTLAMGLAFAALGLLPLPEATAIGYTAPLLVVVFAAMFLNEKVGVYRLSAVALGMLGVMIVLSPRMSLLSGEIADRQAIGALLALMGACFAALAQVFVRNLVRTERTSAIVFWFSITSTVLSLLTIPYGWVMPSAGAAALLVSAGILGGFGQIFLTSAYRFADASLIAPFEYVSMLFALILGYVVFAEVPTGRMLGGALIVISAGVLIIWRERQLGLQRGKAKSGMTPQG